MSEDEERSEPLSIGTIMGGQTAANSRWTGPIRNLTRRVRDARKGIEVPLGVNVVFHIPGNLLQPEFEGLRTGSYSRKRSLLMVQAALPEEPPDDPDAHLVMMLLRAIDEVEPWSKRRRVEVKPRRSTRDRGARCSQHLLTIVPLAANARSLLLITGWYIFVLRFYVWDPRNRPQAWDR
jgi:hypothetical protein